MINNLKKKGLRKKEAARKRRVNLLENMTDEVRDHALKAYFHYCKEQAAKCFIEWRMQQADIAKDPEQKKALRVRRLSNISKFNTEEAIFMLFLKHEENFESVKERLVQMELELQAARNVAMQSSMYDLISGSNAASHYMQAFIDRKKSKDFMMDMDDGQSKVHVERDNRKQLSNVTLDLKPAAATNEFQTPKIISPMSNRLPKNYNSDIDKFAFRTPVDYVDERRKKTTADDVEELVFAAQDATTKQRKAAAEPSIER